jgi:hypothetical protein
MSFLVCDFCNQEIRGNKVILSSLIHGKCAICGEKQGKRIIYTEKDRIKDPTKARQIVTNMRYWDNRFQKKDEEGDTVFLSEVPPDKLKSNVVKMMHLRFGPRNIQCLYALETRKGIVFVHGLHTDDFCPAIKTAGRLRR